MDWEFIGYVKGYLGDKDSGQKLKLFVKIISGLPFYGVSFKGPDINAVYTKFCGSDPIGSVECDGTNYEFDIPPLFQNPKESD